MSAGSEALCRALCLADGGDPDERMTEHDAHWRFYEPQAGTILADPAPLLAALAKAGVLTEEWAVAGMDRNYGFDRMSSHYPELAFAERIQAARGGYIQHRYTTDWEPVETDQEDQS